jgi:hypothetical protein
MAVSFQLPIDLERMLRSGLPDLDARAKETLRVSLYKDRKLSRVALAQALSLDRLETDDLLKRHEVHFEMTAEDVVREAEELRRLRDLHAGRR